MLKSFWSSDKKGTEGIEFGDEWYKTLMSKLDKASVVVCLLTERSLDRPWILYEAGVAKGKLATSVNGIALGVPLSRVSAGPFYQFHNSDDSEEALTKLVLQLCRQIPGLEPDEGVVKDQVRAFKTTVAGILKTISGQKKPEKQEAVNEEAVAKVLEEMKLVLREIPMRVESVMMEGSERLRPRKSPFRRLHPRMIDEMAHMMSQRAKNPIGILLVASLLRDDCPWLYELGLEAYRAAKTGKSELLREALVAFRDAAEFTFHGPLAEEMGLSGRDIELMRDLPAVIHHYVALAEEAPIRHRPVVLKDAKSTRKNGEI